MEDLKNTTVRQAYLQALADDKKFDTYKEIVNESESTIIRTSLY